MLKGGEFLPVHTLGRNGSGLEAVVLIHDVLEEKDERGESFIHGEVVWANEFTRINTYKGKEVWLFGEIIGGVMHITPESNGL